MAEQRRDRRAVVAGAVLGTFLGDALGAPWEGRRPADGRRASSRVERSLASGTLRYTDDTQLTLALAEHLLEHPDVDPSAFVQSILDAYEPWRGYGGGFRQLVGVWKDGRPVDEAATEVFPDGSFGNGAAMRVAPVGVLHAGDLHRVDAVARRQAGVSHAHPLGQDGAAVQARAVALAADRGRFGPEEVRVAAEAAREPSWRSTLASAGHLAERWPDGDAEFGDVAAAIGNEVTAPRSVPAALWVAAVARDLEHAVELALGLGGDADTIAAMAGAIVGAALTDAAIPPPWLDAGEDEARGVGYARDLATRLADAATW